MIEFCGVCTGSTQKVTRNPRYQLFIVNFTIIWVLWEGFSTPIIRTPLISQADLEGFPPTRRLSYNAYWRSVYLFLEFTIIKDANAKKLACTTDKDLCRRLIGRTNTVERPKPAPCPPTSPRVYDLIRRVVRLFIATQDNS